MKVVTTKQKQVVDITKLIEKELVKGEKGICHIFVKHTTCALTTADLDKGTDLDFLDFIDEMVPDLDYRHPHNPEHAPDHIWGSIIGPSVTVPFSDGKLNLGTWQKVILVELHGPKEREVEVSIIAS